ncbi:hypothetical protein BH09MYX1_BH09MYX1_25020 [soil metagenome]
MFVGLSGVVAGCTHTAPPTHRTVVDSRLIRIATYARAFRNSEPEILLQLTEHDSHMLTRIAPKPSRAQYRIADEGSAYLEGRHWFGRDFQDPFLFTDREGDLDGASESLESTELDADLGMRRELLAARGTFDEDPLVKNLAIDQHLLRRLIASERARLERERELPRGASDLLLATADSIPVDPAADDWKAIDATVAWRLDQIKASLRPNELSEADRVDLLESIALIKSFGKKLPRALVLADRLVTALEGLLVAPYPVDEGDGLEHEKAAFIGEIGPIDQLEPAFEGSRVVLRAQLDTAFSVLDPEAVLRVKERAIGLLLRAPPCGPSLPAVTARSLAPPRERAWSCALVKATENANGDIADLAALLALHDASIVASWALATHRDTGSRDPEVAMSRYRTILTLTNTEKRTLSLSAQARPLRAVSAGYAAVLLTQSGGVDVKTRATRWRAFGDAPLDAIKVLLSPPLSAK